MFPTGVRALYKGMAFPFAAQAAFKVVIFTTNGIARRVLDKRGLAESPAGIFACGALAGEPRVFDLIKIDEYSECWTLCAIKMKAGTGAGKGRHLWPHLCLGDEK